VAERDVSGDESAAAGEAPDERRRRYRRRRALYLRAFVLGASLVVLVALIVANTRQVKISWVFGSSSTSLVWIIIVAAALGWIAGITTSVVFRRRTRAPRD
jgi:uncharacterized integral membrane protein